MLLDLTGIQRDSRTAAQRAADQTNEVTKMEPIASYVEDQVLRGGGRLIVDADKGWPIRLNVEPRLAKSLIMTEDRRFKRALVSPSTLGVTHVLLPDPAKAANDEVHRALPHLWNGYEPGYRPVRTFRSGEDRWRLYEVLDASRRLGPAAPPL